MGGEVKPEEYDVVRLKRPLPEHHLPEGSKGTVVMDYSKYSDADVPSAYEIEFVDAGETITVAAEDVEVVTPSGT
jgi:hypothetical protein